MTRRSALLPLVLAAALLAACAPAPTRATLRVAGAVRADATGVATLTARVAARPAGYGLKYMSTADWDEAVGNLLLNGDQAAGQTVAPTRVDADGSRTASFTFTGLEPGAGYTLEVTFNRHDPTGALVAVGSSTSAPTTLVAGANTLTLPAATFLSDATATPGEPEGFVASYVASWPAAGPGGRLGHPQDAVSDGNGTTYVTDKDRDAVLALDTDGVITVIAGGGGEGFADGPGEDARFKNPRGLLLVGDQLYVADTGNHRIRQIDLGDPDHPVTTLAGQGTPGHLDGDGADAFFQSPTAIAGGGTDGKFYVADRDNNRIRRIKVGDAVVVSTFAGTGAAGFADAAAANAIFDHPEGIAVGDGSLYVADTANFLIRRIAFTGLDNAAGDVNTHAGTGVSAYLDGDATAAQFTLPTDLAYDPVTTWLYVADSTSHRVRGVATADPANQVWTYAGTSTSGWRDGVAANGQLVEPFGVSYGATGLTIADRDGARVRFVSQAAELSTVAGDGIQGTLPGDALVAQRPVPAGVALEDGTTPIVTDAVADRVWRVPATGDATVLAGTGVAGYVNGAAGVAQFRDPKAIVRRPDGSFLVADANNHAIRRVLPDGTTSTWAGNGATGDADGDAATARFRTPWGLAYDADGALWVSEACGRIRRITEAPGGAIDVVTIAGANAAAFLDGIGTAARFDDPRGIAVDAEGDVYVADRNNNRIRRLQETAPGVWTVSTFAGAAAAGYVDGDAAAARFDELRDVEVAADGSLYVADSGNHRVRRIAFGNAGWVVTTVAGSDETAYVDGPGAAAGIRDPYALLFGEDGTLFVADHDGGWLRTVKF